MSCDLDEARRLSDLDPSVQAGRLTYDVFEWWLRPGRWPFQAPRTQSASAARCLTCDAHADIRLGSSPYSSSIAMRMRLLIRPLDSYP